MSMSNGAKEAFNKLAQEAGNDQATRLIIEAIRLQTQTLQDVIEDAQSSIESTITVWAKT